MEEKFHCGASTIEAAKRELETNDLLDFGEPEERKARRRKGFADRPTLGNLWKLNSKHFQDVNGKPNPHGEQAREPIPQEEYPIPQEEHDLFPTGITFKDVKNFEIKNERLPAEWDQILEKISSEIQADSYRQWFPEIQYIGIDNGTLRLAAKEITAEWVDKIWAQLIIKAAAKFGVTQIEWTTATPKASEFSN